MNLAQTIGACMAVIGVIVMALKLASMWGQEKQKRAELEKRDGEKETRLKALEDASHDVPEEVREKVKKHLEAADSGNRMLRNTMAKVVLAIKQLERRISVRDGFCQGMHGDAVQPVEEQISDRIELPPEVDDGPQG